MGWSELGLEQSPELTGNNAGAVQMSCPPIDGQSLGCHQFKGMPCLPWSGH